MWSIPCGGRVSLLIWEHVDIYTCIVAGTCTSAFGIYHLDENTIAKPIPFMSKKALLSLVISGFDFCKSFSWESYLVDPASSHMLVSKIKPCMS